ncbi:MAG TPA: hypothetical protein VK468_03760 [Pyrinomonadaceae bacterium]|nr:hypothetical protein [Pyrinomonadaceae bacterium]
MNSDFRDLLEAFNDAGVEYLIIGGYAVIKHTEPRFTKDLDLWVATDIENSVKVYTALLEFGAPIEKLTPADFAEPGAFFTMGLPPNRIDIMFDLNGVVPRQAWERRVEGTFGDIPVHFIGRDDLISNKEAVGRLQDLADAEKLRQTS